MANYICTDTADNTALACPQLPSVALDDVMILLPAYLHMLNKYRSCRLHTGSEQFDIHVWHVHVRDYMDLLTNNGWLDLWLDFDNFEMTLTEPFMLDSAVYWLDPQSPHWHVHKSGWFLISTVMVTVEYEYTTVNYVIVIVSVKERL